MCTLFRPINSHTASRLVSIDSWHYNWYMCRSVICLIWCSKSCSANSNVLRIDHSFNSITLGAVQEIQVYCFNSEQLLRTWKIILRKNVLRLIEKNHASKGKEIAVILLKMFRGFPFSFLYHDFLEHFKRMINLLNLKFSLCLICDQFIKA